MMQNLLRDLTELLSKDDRLVSEGKLLKNKVIELALKMDSDLIKLLLKSKPIKKHFFADADGVLVFDKIKFQKFVSNKQFLPDSYTAFKNKIGLVNENGDYLSESKEVVLAWPYKDCVLEGGQTKEDQKRDEIFWNETLAPDEIDRLRAPKVFTNLKRYDKDGEHPLSGKEEIDFSKENLIVKGNNLLALYSLHKRFAGQVKLIYIDPPFNRDADTFYNDSFKHSTWLVFMRNRLTIAKSLLSQSGHIFIHLDDSEVDYCKVMADEVFGRGSYRNHIVVTTNKPFGYKGTSESLFKQGHHILWYSKSTTRGEKLQNTFVEKEYDTAYNLVFENMEQEENNWTWRGIDDVVAEELGHRSSKDAIRAVGIDEFKSQIALFALRNKNRVFQAAGVSGGAYLKRKATIEKSAADPRKIYRHPNDDMDYMFIGGRRVIFYGERFVSIDGLEVPAETITDVWTDISYEGLAKEGGIELQKTKKPEKLLMRIISLLIKPGDLVLDYHLGSGTTCAVAHKMCCRYIGIEQLDYGENDSVVRLQNVIKGDQSGISKSVNWQGGGSFICCELMQHNEAYVARIKKAKSTRDMLTIWTKMQNKAFISYKVEPRVINENISEFEKLSLDEQKRFLVEILDKNQLYVNYSEMDDAEYGISERDKKLNRKFYEEG